MQTQHGAARGPRTGGVLASRLRLATGLVLFAFALSHFGNHALGLISLDVMEAAAGVRRAIWQNLVGTVLLYGSLALHMALALWKTLRRRTWRMPLAEAAQLALGLTIPLMLVDHIVGTRLLDELFDIDDTYVHQLSILWPGLARWQSILLLVVWVHGCIGIYFWLRYRSWFPKAAPTLACLAVMLPSLAILGWIEAARRLHLADEDVRALTREAVVWAGPVIETSRIALIVLILATLAISLTVSLGLFDRGRVAVTYPGGRTVRARPGQTVLEVSRENGIAHTSVCGGRARCSTCRTRITDGLSALPAPEAGEQAVLKRISAPTDVRLACQLRPRHSLSVQPLLPATSRTLPAAGDSFSWGVEQVVSVLFVDIRGFTALSERRLPFDVVFILNEYLSTMGGIVTNTGGVVDKYIGDSVMALFGVGAAPGTGARQALGAAAAMLEAVEALNARLTDQLDAPLSVGIGVHAGPAILGRVGVDRTAGGITALGDTVNTASRLEGATKELGTPLVISRAVAGLAGAPEGALAAEEVALRGRERTIAVHAIAAPDILRAAIPDLSTEKPRLRLVPA